MRRTRNAFNSRLILDFTVVDIPSVGRRFTAIRKENSPGDRRGGN